MQLIYFIIGIFFIILVLPLVENISELLCLIIENCKCYFAKNIAKMNKDIEELSNEDLYSTNAIGFEIPSNIEEYLDDDEEEEENKCKCKNHKHKIGF